MTAVVDSSTELINQDIGDHAHDSNFLQRNVRNLEEQAIKKAADNHNASQSVLDNLTNTVATTTQGNALK